jgi:hypothetical protein
MDIETLAKIKMASSEALKGRMKLDKMHKAFTLKCAGRLVSRAVTTTYNAKTADVMENIVVPNESILKTLLK